MPRNVNDWYSDALSLLAEAPINQSRNGKVKAATGPTLITVARPTERVLFCPLRRANPYFHLMETVWMFAGEKKVGWLEDFNSNITSFAEDDNNINGAYGHRWINHFGFSQIDFVVGRLASDPDTRQAVIDMYDPNEDRWEHLRDRPCNTHIYFRRRGSCLDMTVCNRSNDVVWGMCGANAVHMTYLHELVAAATNMAVGHYHVMSNNLHIYERHWPLLSAAGSGRAHDYYEKLEVCPLPLVAPGEDWQRLLEDCKEFMRSPEGGSYSCRWLCDVVAPMYSHYMARRSGNKESYDITETKAPDWQRAEQEWRKWHDS